MKHKNLILGLVLMLVVLCLITLVASNSNPAPSPQPQTSNTMTVRHPNNSEATMFDTISVCSGFEGIEMTEIANGTVCTVLNRDVVSVCGTDLVYHRLDCDGERGYINIQWVR